MLKPQNLEKATLLDKCYEGMSHIRRFCYGVESDRAAIITMVEALSIAFHPSNGNGHTAHTCLKCQINEVNSTDWYSGERICKICRPEILPEAFADPVTVCVKCKKRPISVERVKKKDLICSRCKAIATVLRNRGLEKEIKL